MERKRLVIIVLSVVVLFFISGIVFVSITHADGQSMTNPAMAQETAPGDEENGTDDGDYTYIPPSPVDGSVAEDSSSSEDQNETKAPFVPATKIDLDPSSITVFVNREYNLPKDYKPKDLVTPNVIFNLVTYDERTLMRPEAAKALEELFQAAKEQNIILYGISAYRSYERQYTIFTNNIAKKGKTYTLRYSAVPGTSEHQTGLSIDVSAKSQGFKLDDNFAASPEGIWLAANAHTYGYIIRYPKGNEDITGYAFEPWHIRYVGKDLSEYLYANNLTLEEYYKYTPSPGFDFEAKYADMINYVPPVVTKAPVVSVTPSVTPTLPAEEEKQVTPTPKDAAITNIPKDTNTDDPGKSEDDTTTDEQDGASDGSDPAAPDDGTPSATLAPSIAPTPTMAPTPTPDPADSDITSETITLAP